MGVSGEHGGRSAGRSPNRRRKCGRAGSQPVVPVGAGPAPTPTSLTPSRVSIIGLSCPTRRDGRWTTPTGRTRTGADVEPQAVQRYPARYSVEPLAVAPLPTCVRHTCAPKRGQMPAPTPGPARTPSSVSSARLARSQMGVPRREPRPATRPTGRSEADGTVQATPSPKLLPPGEAERQSGGRSRTEAGGAEIRTRTDSPRGAVTRQWPPATAGRRVFGRNGPGGAPGTVHLREGVNMRHRPHVPRLPWMRLLLAVAAGL